MRGQRTHYVLHDTRDDFYFCLFRRTGYNIYTRTVKFPICTMHFKRGTQERLGLMIHLTISLSKPIGLNVGLLQSWIVMRAVVNQEEPVHTPNTSCPYHLICNSETLRPTDHILSLSICRQTHLNTGNKPTDMDTEIALPNSLPN